MKRLDYWLVSFGILCVILSIAWACAQGAEHDIRQPITFSFFGGFLATWGFADYCLKEKAHR